MIELKSPTRINFQSRDFLVDFSKLQVVVSECIKSVPDNLSFDESVLGATHRLEYDGSNERPIYRTKLHDK